jgi:hypothetical protein
MERPTRIDLLELDIDLRLADLWREAADVGEWNLEVVAAFLLGPDAAFITGADLLMDGGVIATLRAGRIHVNVA